MTRLDRLRTRWDQRCAATPAAAVLLVTAGAIHFSVAAQHFGEWWAYGTFFVLLGSAQCGAGLVVASGQGRRLADATGWATLAVVLLWTATRTTGLPVGPHPWTPEPVTWLDAVATAIELATAAACFALHAAGEHGEPVIPAGQPIVPSGPPVPPAGQPVPPAGRPVVPAGQPVPPAGEDGTRLPPVSQPATASSGPRMEAGRPCVPA